MKRKILITALLFVIAIMVAPGGQKVGASGWSFHYVVYATTCNVSYPMPNGPIGDWVVDCDENWTGWGVLPYSQDCTYTDATALEYCGPDHNG